MEKAQTWAQRSIIALLAVFVACCCTFLAGCAENAEDAVRKVVTKEFDEAKNLNAEQAEALASASNEFSALSQLGITTAEVYEALYSDFDFKIDNIKVDGDKATAGMTFTVKDITNLYSSAQENLQAAMSNGELASQSDIGTVILDTIRNLPTRETGVVDINLVKVSGEWRMSADTGTILREALFPTSVMNQ